jgi:hypothetical protein
MKMTIMKKKKKIDEEGEGHWALSELLLNPSDGLKWDRIK